MLTLDQLVDHAWLDNGQGVLTCVAGSQHTRELAAGCPYYFRGDLAAQLTPGSRPSRGGLHYRGAWYVKVTHLAAPGRWHDLIAQLPPAHGLSPLPCSLLSALDLRNVVACVEPRAALCQAAAQPPHGHDCGQRWLTALLTALGDPQGERGDLGLTGSAALDLTRLCRGNDLDLLVYPSLDPDRLRRAVHQLGGRFLCDLHPDEPAWQQYAATRPLPGTLQPDARARLWARRWDVCWLGGLRVDFTRVPEYAMVLPVLPYAAADLGPYQGNATVTAVAIGYPVALEVRASDCTRVLITARGYEGVFRPGDRILIAGRRRGGPGHVPFVSVDDHPHQRVTLAS